MEQQLSLWGSSPASVAAPSFSAPVRVAVFGSRAWPLSGPAAALVRSFVAGLPCGSIVLSGGAEGADALASSAAFRAGLSVVVWPAPFGGGAALRWPYRFCGLRARCRVRVARLLVVVANWFSCARVPWPGWRARCWRGGLRRVLVPRLVPRLRRGGGGGASFGHALLCVLARGLLVARLGSRGAVVRLVAVCPLVVPLPAPAPALLPCVILVQ